MTTEIETTVRDSAIAEFERLYGDPWEGAVGVIDVWNPDGLSPPADPLIMR